jgi:hypothetical protein
VALGVLVGLAAGCSSDKSCTELCGEAQAEGCTFVEGDCAKFCAAMGALGDRASCASQADAFEQCLAEGDVCASGTRCATQQDGYLGCVTPFCQQQAPPDPDCMTVETALIPTAP